MAGYKTISTLFLLIVVALAGGSPVFARNDQAPMELNPTSACPGTLVLLGAFFSSAANAISYSVSSYPDGLISELLCTGPIPIDSSGLELACTFVVSESACGGVNTITVTLQLSTEARTVSGTFEVPNTCGRACATVGGCVQPVNNVALLSPWLAVIGFVGCISTVVVVARKREK